MRNLKVKLRTVSKKLSKFYGTYTINMPERPSISGENDDSHQYTQKSLISRKNFDLSDILRPLAKSV